MGDYRSRGAEHSAELQTEQVQGGDSDAYVSLMLVAANIDYRCVYKAR